MSAACPAYVFANDTWTSATFGSIFILGRKSLGTAWMAFLPECSVRSHIIPPLIYLQECRQNNSSGGLERFGLSHFSFSCEDQFGNVWSLRRIIQCVFIFIFFKLCAAYWHFTADSFTLND